MTDRPHNYRPTFIEVIKELLLAAAIIGLLLAATIFSLFGTARAADFVSVSRVPGGGFMVQRSNLDASPHIIHVPQAAAPADDDDNAAMNAKLRHEVYCLHNPKDCGR